MTNKNKIIIGLIGIAAFIGIISANNSQKPAVEGTQITVTITASPTETPTKIPTPAYTPTLTATPTPINNFNQSYQQNSTSDNSQNGLSNNNYYTNSDGNQVHSPAYSNSDSVPAGATALCADGTYSFSQHHRGTCSHHWGVVQWYQ